MKTAKRIVIGVRSTGGLHSAPIGGGRGPGIPIGGNKGGHLIQVAR